MSDNTNTHALPLYALGRYGSGAGRRYTRFQQQLDQMDLIMIRIFRPYRDPEDTEIPSPETFYDLKMMACEECGVRARPREFVFFIEHRTQMGSRQYSHRVQLEAWNWGRFRDCLRNPATAPVIEVFWQPTLATLRDLRDAVYFDNDEDESSEWSSYA